MVSLYLHFILQNLKNGDLAKIKTRLIAGFYLFAFRQHITDSVACLEHTPQSACQ